MTKKTTTIGSDTWEWDETPEVKAAKERFHRFFQFVLDGMLDKLSPKPGYNQIPEQIADFYIKEWIF